MRRSSPCGVRPLRLVRRGDVVRCGGPAGQGLEVTGVPCPAVVPGLARAVELAHRHRLLATGAAGSPCHGAAAAAARRSRGTGRHRTE